MQDGIRFRLADFHHADMLSISRAASSSFSLFSQVARRTLHAPLRPFQPATRRHSSNWGIEGIGYCKSSSTRTEFKSSSSAVYRRQHDCPQLQGLAELVQRADTAICIEAIPTGQDGWRYLTGICRLSDSTRACLPIGELRHKVLTVADHVTSLPRRHAHRAQVIPPDAHHQAVGTVSLRSSFNELRADSQLI